MGGRVGDLVGARERGKGRKRKQGGREGGRESVLVCVVEGAG